MISLRIMRESTRSSEQPEGPRAFRRKATTERTAFQIGPFASISAFSQA
jgi:hypothetical protein